MTIKPSIKPPIGEPFHAIDKAEMQVAYADYVDMVQKYIHVSDELTKFKKSPYPSWCCPSCGEPIGWLGRVFPFHKCKPLDKPK